MEESSVSWFGWLAPCVGLENRGRLGPDGVGFASHGEQLTSLGGAGAPLKDNGSGAMLQSKP